MMPRVIELCLSGSLGSFHWYCRAREEGAVSQEGEKFESVLHTFSGSLASVVLTLSWQPPRAPSALPTDLLRAWCWEWHLPLL